MNNKKIVFLGTPEIAAIFLDGIIKAGIKISLVVTKPDKVRARNNKIVESEVSKVARNHNIKVFKPERINDNYSVIKSLKPDLLLTFAYGQILTNDVLKLSKYKPLNIHGSLLPKYRGASPIQQAIKNGDKETGVSIIEMISKMDAGPIYARKEIEIDIKDTYSSLCNKVAYCSINLFTSILDDYFNNKIKPIFQDESSASYCHYIRKEDCKLSLDEDVDSFVNHVRYLSYTPGAYFLSQDGIVKIFEVEKYFDEVNSQVGQLIIEKNNLLLKLKSGIVKINQLQFPGKKIISAKDYINGNKNKKSLILY